MRARPGGNGGTFATDSNFVRRLTAAGRSPCGDPPAMLRRHAARPRALWSSPRSTKFTITVVSPHGGIQFRYPLPELSLVDRSFTAVTFEPSPTRRRRVEEKQTKNINKCPKLSRRESVPQSRDAMFRAGFDEPKVPRRIVVVVQRYPRESFVCLRLSLPFCVFFLLLIAGSRRGAAPAVPGPRAITVTRRRRRRATTPRPRRRTASTG